MIILAVTVCTLLTRIYQSDNEFIYSCGPTLGPG